MMRSPRRGALWTVCAVLLVLSVVCSVAAVRLESDFSLLARWATTGGVVVGLLGVHAATPPTAEGRHRRITLALVGLLTIAAYGIGKVEFLPQRVPLDPSGMAPRSISVDIRGEPVASQLYRVEVYAPPDRGSGGSRLRLLEDGSVLGPSGALNSQIAQWGMGAYRHAAGVLSFSSSDASDPRTNGRSYEALRYPAVPGSVLAVLLAGLAVAYVRWLRLPTGPQRPVAAATGLAVASILALNVFHIDDASLNIKDARENLEMAQAIATTVGARDPSWLLSQRREPLPNLVLAAQMRLDPRLDGIVRGESVQAAEFQVPLKQNNLIYVALLYAFGLLAMRRILRSHRQWLSAFALFVGFAHFLFLQFPEYINRNYTEVHAAAFLVMSGYFLLRYAGSRSGRDGLLASGALLALTLTKGLFVIVFGAVLVVLAIDMAARWARRQPAVLRRAVVAGAAVAILLGVSAVGAMAAWGARLSTMPASQEVATNVDGYAMDLALPGRMAIPAYRSFWNVRDGSTLQQRFFRNLPPLVRPDDYERGYEVGSRRIPYPPIWDDPRFTTRREAQAAAVAVVIYNYLRDPIATVGTAASLGALLIAAPRSVDLSPLQRDVLRLLAVVMFAGSVLRLLSRRDPVLWFYLPTIFGMVSYSLLAHGRYRYWAPFVPTTLMATAVGIVLIYVAVERRLAARQSVTVGGGN